MWFLDFQRDIVNFSTDNRCSILYKLKTTDYKKEPQILFRLKDGDESALAELIGLYKQPLALAMLRMLKSREDVEELLQELFLRVWKNREQIDAERPIRAYLYKIAENLVYDRLRKAAREKQLAVDYFANLVEAYSHIEEGVFDQETKAFLQEAIDQLPAQRKRVFELCKIEGRSYEEVSQMLAISIATVNSHITNANSTLKAYFRQRPELATVVFLSVLFSI